jgi:hypothetical protein
MDVKEKSAEEEIRLPGFRLPQQLTSARALPIPVTCRFDTLGRVDIHRCNRNAPNGLRSPGRLGGIRRK